MNKALLCFGLVSSLALPNNVEASGPDAVLISDASYHCIGGQRCGRDTSYTLDVGSINLITYVVVSADDNVGDKTKAHLQCYVDGIFAGELDVSKAGGLLSFFPNLVGRRVEFRSVSEDHNPNGDETRIFYVLVEGHNP